MRINTSRKSGFTLVEIMIVVAIIGLLAAIAIPNFVKARTTSQKNACIANMRQIDGAMEQAALENNMAQGAAITAAQVLPFLKNTTTMPSCPAGTAVYAVANVGTPPTCPNTIAGHVLP